MTHTLLIEDDPHLQILVQTLLEREGWSVDTVSSAEEGLEFCKKKRFDLVLVDWMLSGKQTGLDFCKQLSQTVHPPIPTVLLTSRNQPIDMVLGLEMGADDYITKPFEPSVLIARLRAVLRRSSTHSPRIQNPVSTDVLEVGPLRIEVSKVQVSCNGKKISLTAAEFRLLVELAKNVGKVLSRAQLLESIQLEPVAVVDRVIDTHIYTLRTKLQDCGERIETVRGMGYRLHD